MKIKNIFGYSLLFVLVISSIIFAACASIKTEAYDFKFSFEPNSAVKVVEQQPRVKLSLEVENKLDDKNKLSAELFKLYKGDELVSEDVYFGSNIIDRMESEELEAKGKVEIIVNLGLTKDVAGNLDLWYNETKLMTIKV